MLNNFFKGAFHDEKATTGAYDFRTLKHFGPICYTEFCNVQNSTPTNAI